MKYGSLFSGIGGFDLGFDRAGMQCAWQVEIDEKARSVLQHHWPDVPKYKDVTNVGKRNLESVDLICGGFPCQDLSVAGKRAGLDGTRSGLWFEFYRVIAELKPQWVVIENVPGLLSSNGGSDFAVILQGLAKCGYYAAWRVLDAQFYGVPQRRRRVFIVGSLGNGRCTEVLFEQEGSPWDTPPRRETRADVAATAIRRAQTSSNGWGIDSEISHTLDGTSSVDAVICHENKQGELTPSDHAKALRSDASHSYQFLAFGGNNTNGPIDVATAANAHGSRRYDFESETFVCNAFNGYTGGADDNDAQAWHYVPSLSETLNSGGNDGGFRTEPGAHLVAPDVAPTLQKESYSPTKTSTGQALDWCITNLRQGVRRLTPTECERLQGFPDKFTAGQSDSARYRQLGNAVAVPVAEWLGRQLMAVKE